MVTALDSFIAFEGKSTESPSPSKVSPSFTVSSSTKVLSWFVSVPCSKNYASNQEALRVEANDSERPFICPIQPRLGVGG